MKKNFIFIFCLTLGLTTSSFIKVIPQLNTNGEVQAQNTSTTDKTAIYERLLRERVIVLNGEITDKKANSIIAQMLYLESIDNTKPIYIYINSPGGNVTAGLGIFDTMNQVKPDIVTINIGLAASMGGFLLAAGTPGQRFALKNSRVMIHQPVGEAQGEDPDLLEIQAKEILYLKKQLNSYLAQMTGQSIEKIKKDTQQDFWLSAQEAKEYGIVDKVINSRSQIKK